MSPTTREIPAARAVAAHSPAITPRRGSVVRALARGELRRMLRSPWWWLGVLVSAAQVWSMLRPPEWSGARYNAWVWVPTGLYVGTAVVTAISFHRERAGLAADAPTGERTRCLAKLLAGAGLVAVTAGFVVGLAGYVWAVQGVDLGDEPGRTLHAYPTLAELVQPVCLAVLAVATGAAAGRRMRHRAAAILTLLLGWLCTSMYYWLFSGDRLNPISILQTQPVTVPVTPPQGDPSQLPADWLLGAPGDYQTYWARLVVSESLAWWHAGWLLGLALLCLAAALPTGSRRLLCVTGAALALVCAVASYVVYP